MTDSQKPGTVTAAIGGVRTGDERAFETLVERYRSRVEHWLDRRLGHYRSGLDRADDLAQGVLLNLWLALKGNRTWVQEVASTASLEKLLLWLVTCQALRAIRLERAKKRAGTVHDQDVETPDGTDLVAALPDPGPDPADSALFGLTMAEILASLDREITLGKAVFEDWLAGLSVAESGQRNKISPSTVDRRRSMVRDWLKAWFGREIADIARAEEDAQ